MSKDPALSFTLSAKRRCHPESAAADEEPALNGVNGTLRLVFAYLPIAVWLFALAYCFILSAVEGSVFGRLGLFGCPPFAVAPQLSSLEA